MSADSSCQECGSEIPVGAPQGICPRCVIGSALATLDAEPPRTGRTFGEYEILDRLGEGGAGVVYRAQHRDLKRIVALKLLRGGPAASDPERRRFRVEALSVAQLQHPGLVTLYEVGEVEGTPFIAMEYMPARSLADQLRSEGPFDPDRAATYLRTVAEVIHFCHERGVIHRDLKPSNILLNVYNQPRVSDFGLARHLDSPSELTASGDVIGTVRYASPEQIQGRRGSVGIASDIYSLGASLYELLAGRPPFTADSMGELQEKILHREAAPLPSIRPEVPVDLDTICSKCLAKEPDRRYPTAAELALDLGRFLRREPVLARPITIWIRAQRWMRRHPLITIAILSLELAASIALFGAWVATRSLERELCEEVLRSNVHAAQGIASTVLWQFATLGESVAHLAAQSELRQAIQSRDQDRLRALVRQFCDRHAVGSGGNFNTVVIEDAEGRALAHGPRNFNIDGMVFRGRNYFLGARQHGPELKGRDAVHVSRVFHSQDDGLYKLAVSAPVWEGTNFTGVVAATISLRGDLGHPLGDRMRTVVLVAPIDNNPRESAVLEMPRRDFTVVLHPALVGTNRSLVVPLTGMRAVREPLPGGAFVLRETVPALDGMNEDYRDPCEVLGPAWSGRWLAGFAPVGNTECLVIVQQRYSDTLALVRALARRFAFWGGLAVLAVAGGGWAGWRWTQKSKIERLRELSSSGNLGSA